MPIHHRYSAQYLLFSESDIWSQKGSLVPRPSQHSRKYWVRGYQKGNRGGSLNRPFAHTNDTTLLAPGGEAIDGRMPKRPQLLWQPSTATATLYCNKDAVAKRWKGFCVSSKNQSLLGIQIWSNKNEDILEFWLARMWCT